MNKTILLIIVLSIQLLSCKDNIEQEQNDKYVYDYEVYNTQEILLSQEDKRQKLKTYKQLVNIDGNDVIIFNMSNCYMSFYDLESGEKIHISAAVMAVSVSCLTLKEAVFEFIRNCRRSSPSQECV